MKVLFINHKAPKCGVYEYGFNIANSLKNMRKFTVVYAECSNVDELKKAFSECNYPFVIYNYHSFTLPFLNAEIILELRGSTHIGLMHEISREQLTHFNNTFFDYFIFGDPTLSVTNHRVFKIGRLLPNYQPAETQLEHEYPVIGSFGFAVGHKNYGRIIKQTEKEFDKATIRINIASNDVIDKEGNLADSYAKKLRSLIKKPGIKLEITHHYFSKQGLLNFLNKNSINLFLYEDWGTTYGISSATDIAIAAKRPIAVSDCNMFRHLFSLTPSIVIFNSLKKRILYKFYSFFSKKYSSTTLKKIIKNGLLPLNHLYSEWNEEKFSNDFEDILNKISGQTKLNRLLNNTDKNESKDTTNLISSLSSDN